MVDLADIEAEERSLARRWHAAHIEAFERDPHAGRGWRAANIQPHAAEGAEFIEELRRTRDLVAFQTGTGSWVANFDSGYRGTAGQMIINQIVKLAPDLDAAVSVLLEALTVPEDLAEAEAKIAHLADYLESIRVGAHPTAKRAPFVASYYWGLQEPTRWPVAWPRTMEYLDYCGGAVDDESQASRYARLWNFIQDADGSVLRFEEVAAWWAESRPVMVNDVLCDRAALREGAKERGDQPEWYRRNARALVAVSQHIGLALGKVVAEHAHRTLEHRWPQPTWDREWPRGDTWVDWRVPKTYGLAIRLWINANGAAVGLRPFPEGAAGESDRVASVLEANPVAGYEIFGTEYSKTWRRVGFIGGGPGEIIYGKWFPRDSMNSTDFPAEIAGAASDLASLIASLNGEVEPAGDPLGERVAEFKTAMGFPTAVHEQEIADRRDFATTLAEEDLEVADKAALRRIWQAGSYGGTGPMSTLNASLRGADEAEYARILDTFRYLCWGSDPVAVRIDRVLEDPGLKIKGFGESVAMKMLAICYPEQFITIYPYSGPKGKLRMVKLLDLPVPEGTRGELQVASNDAIRERLDRYFPNDPLAIGEFLYWYLERTELPPAEANEDPLDGLADELLVDRAFIEDVVSLLEEKQQIVLYGPPGTGKTYFARKLAEALVPEPERRPIVQFHPSTSYEDFFEGYRPDSDGDGILTYRLQQGPLAQLAARATDSPGRRHAMIIDEINRANLPKVLGELLFLFEYRDTPVRTLYRPDDPFTLPKNVWFIGTMNTADRSIALVDAALRRRFYFIPFFPNYGPMAGMLDRWLEREGQPAWIGDLVSQVNAELVRELNGPDLQIGPSYFMKKGLDQGKLRLIWQYNVEPLIEDQFFGDPERIARFRFEEVWKRFQDLAGDAISEDPAGEPGES